MIPRVTWGSDFTGLTNYLIENRDHEVLSLRGVTSTGLAAVEMQAVAVMSERVRQPAMHVSFSAAIEDGVLPRKMWLELADESEREFGLVGHQRVVVRHRDKNYDHIHIFWCTVNDDTGRTPPKQWFRARGAPQPEIDQRALGDEHLAVFPAGTSVRGAFSRFALSRLMSISRDFEVTRGLRRLRNRKAIAAAREAGETRPLHSGDRHREERTGRPSLSASADVIRAALDLPDWPDARAALNLAGFDLEPIARRRKDGTEEYRGIVIIDLADRGNRSPASSFDMPNRNYGMRQIERRREAGASTSETWWPSCTNPALAVLCEKPEGEQTREEYERLRQDHRLAEGKRAEERRQLARGHCKERQRLRVKLMRLRRLRAAQLLPAQRRAFYGSFSATTRAAIWALIDRRQASERALLRRRSMPVWSAFLSERQSLKASQASERPPALIMAPLAQTLGRRQALAACAAAVAPTAAADSEEAELNAIALLDLARRQQHDRGR